LAKRGLPHPNAYMAAIPIIGNGKRIDSGKTGGWMERTSLN